MLERPLQWKKPKRIFVNSMSDLFHDDVSEEFVQDVAEVPFFFKQWGGINKKKTGRLLKNRTWDEFPENVPTSGTA